jgi:molecular chaperone HtpG
VSHKFQVDLRGVVDLLSHHLYASPRVYLRELLQNAADAIAAGRADEDDPVPARIVIEPADATADGCLRLHDTGVGLTEREVHELLATIGRSSKRDELGFARQDFLGQFGVGLLSCFLVADEIVLETRAANAPTVRWTGHSDGRYDVTTPAMPRDERGTTVTLRPRRGCEQWLSTTTVTELARLYASFLPVTVQVGPVVTTTGSLPWAGAGRDRTLREYAQATFGFEPFDIIDLAVPEAGLTGVAFVLPTPANPAARAGHRVYLKRMLLTESAGDILPEWAFFAKCVLDTTELKPTASREALYEDTLLDSVRESLGDQLRGWIVRLAARDPRRLGDFLSVHRLGVKALALYDDDMLTLVDQWLPVETNVGQLTLADFRERYQVLRYSPTTDQFRQLAAAAAAQDVALINGGYVYDADLIERLPQLDASIVVERLDPTDLATRFDALAPHVEFALRPFVAAAQRALDPLGCELVLRSFEPSGLAAMYLIDRETAFRGELRSTKEKADPIWADVLSALDGSARDVRPQLVLNYRNALVRRVTVLTEQSVVALAVEALYGQALMLGYHPIRPADAALMNRSFLGLLDRALPGEVVS